MPKTDVKKIESEDVSELSDEALDRTANAKGCGCFGVCQSQSPAE